MITLPFASFTLVAQGEMHFNHLTIFYINTQRRLLCCAKSLLALSLFAHLCLHNTFFTLFECLTQTPLIYTSFLWSAHAPYFYSIDCWTASTWPHFAPPTHFGPEKVLCLALMKCSWARGPLSTLRTQSITHEATFTVQPLTVHLPLLKQFLITINRA